MKEGSVSRRETEGFVFEGFPVVNLSAAGFAKASASKGDSRWAMVSSSRKAFARS